MKNVAPLVIPAPARRAVAVRGGSGCAAARTFGDERLVFAAVWSAYVPGWTSNVIVDAALWATCLLSPLNSVVCGALALV